MTEIFSAPFWFNPRPDVFSPAGFRTYLILMLLLLVLAVFAGIFKNRQKGPYAKLAGKWQTFAWLNLVIGLFCLLFRQELIPYLSARILLLVWFAGALTWLAVIARELKKIPEIRQKNQKEEEFKKYIP